MFVLKRSDKPLLAVQVVCDNSPKIDWLLRGKSFIVPVASAVQAVEIELLDELQLEAICRTDS